MRAALATRFRWGRPGAIRHLPVGAVPGNGVNEVSDVRERPPDRPAGSGEGIYRALAANLPNGAAFVIGPDLRYQVAEGQALRAVGLSPADFEGRTVEEVADPDERERCEANLRRALAGEPFHVEHTTHGREFVTDGVPLRDPGGAVYAVLTVSYDVTDRKRAVEALRESQHRLRTALSAARMGTWHWDIGTDRHTSDATLAQWFGGPPTETARPLDGFLALLHPDDRPQVRAAFARAACEGAAFTVEFRVPGPGRAGRWLRDQGDVLLGDDGHPRSVSGACADVTALKEAEEALRRAQEELEERVRARTAELSAAYAALAEEMEGRRELARRLATAAEEQRRRIARELHDEMGQHVAALTLELKALDGAVPAEPLARLLGLADQIGREVHRVALELRPLALDDLGLLHALRTYVEDWGARAGVATTLHVVGGEGERFAPDVETTVYRVVQEALTNVLRHAGAARVSVVVERQPTQLAVTVADDGRGFDPGAAGTDRLGLAGMRERAALLGGSVEVESVPGAGTTVYLRLPLGQPS